NAKVTYPVGVSMTMILLFLSYTVPIASCLTVSTDTSLWKQGFYADCADSVSPWLGLFFESAVIVSLLDWLNAGVAVTVTGMLSNFGVYTVALSTTSQALAAMGRNDPSSGMPR